MVLRLPPDGGKADIIAMPALMDKYMTAVLAVPLRLLISLCGHLSEVVGWLGAHTEAGTVVVIMSSKPGSVRISKPRLPALKVSS